MKPIALMMVPLALMSAAVAIHAATRNPGMQRLETEQYGRARTYFQGILNKDPNNPAAAAGLAKVDCAEHHNQAAVAWAIRAVHGAPQDAGYQVLLGDIYAHYIHDVGLFSELGIARKMLAAYRRAVALAPGNAQAHYRLATYYIDAPGMAGGSTAKARAQISILAQLDPVRAAWLRAHQAVKRKRYSKAEAILRSAVTLDKTGASNFRLGRLLEQRKHYAEAIRVLQAGVQKDPRDSDNDYQIGHAALLGKIQIETGIRALRRYLTLPHGWEGFAPYKWAHYRLGMLYRLAGDAAAEKAEYEAALKSDPHFKAARRALAAMQSGP